MTQAGVGSILFDSFKINETLKDELGLEVNLGSEIRKEEGSYLAGRSSADSGVGRVRTATTVEIKKSITEELNLSVSSTLGGSIGQRQSMNLNYNINNKVSLEGVYESRSSSEGDNINVGNSLGADLKFKWSFK
jgi:translocation and assembly module TamB